ncbi:BNR repeat domain protein [Chondromyces apiculatus DSM 436]|uniref:BNR repeat domain protein n=2 Tax=Chondromyces apiculatus TaxID=51 RepID=A0A017T7H5_9BACT|nr:BNR repeat domain protein [Chondromyces apiculatus DSM 436]
MGMSLAGACGGDERDTSGGGAGSGAHAGAGSTGTGGAGGAGNPGTTPAWQVALDEGDLDGAVLSIWGSGPEDVYAVGGPLGNSGPTSLVVHFDGASWRRLSPGGNETFWWVGGSGPDDVWMVGEGGRITHLGGQGFTEHTSGTTATLWGVWSAGPDEAWAVGGTPGGQAGEDDVVLHWDGTMWIREVLPGAPLGRALYKVWGASADDVYVVGEAGVMWRRQAGTWTRLPELTQSTLFTVTGCGPDEVWAVGGSSVLRAEGGEFTALDVSLPNLVNGVACGPPGSVLVVGSGGVKHRLVEGQWVSDFLDPPNDDLHSAWADGQGAFWAAGGDFFTSPAAGPRRGVVARFGPGTVATSITP